MKMINEQEKHAITEGLYVSKFGINGGYLFDSWVDKFDEHKYFLTHVEGGRVEILQLEEAEIPSAILEIHKEMDVYKQLNSIQLTVAQVDLIVEGVATT